MSPLYVEVKAERTGAIVALGDSITDWTNSTTDANHRWPNFLTQRLLAHHRKIAVVDKGIGGNRLHDITGPNALARLDRDVLTKSGASAGLISLLSQRARLVDVSSSSAVRVRKMEEELEKHFRLNTVLNRYSLPKIRDTIEINRGRSAKPSSFSSPASYE